MEWTNDDFNKLAGTKLLSARDIHNGALVLCDYAQIGLRGHMGLTSDPGSEHNELNHLIQFLRTTAGLLEEVAVKRGIKIT